MNLKHILDMGGYGLYVWPAYAITLFVFGINLIVTFYENREIKSLLKNAGRVDNSQVTSGFCEVKRRRTESDEP